MLKASKVLNAIVAAMISFSLIIPAPLYAQDSDAEEESIPLDLRISPITQGTAAPFSGLLLTTDAMVKIRFDHQLEIDLLRNDLQYQLNISQSELDTQRRLWEVERGLYTTQLDSRDLHIKNLEDVLIKRRDLTPLWVVLGFVGGAATTIGITYAVSGATQ
jgi:hypothetical protein